MSNDSLTTAILQELATKATKEIVDAIFSHFQKDGDDKFYRRAMVGQSGSNYGCTLIVDVHFVDYDKSAHIVTRFGAKP